MKTRLSACISFFRKPNVIPLAAFGSLFLTWYDLAFYNVLPLGSIANEMSVEMVCLIATLSSVPVFFLAVIAPERASSLVLSSKLAPAMGVFGMFAYLAVIVGFSQIGIAMQIAGAVLVGLYSGYGYMVLLLMLRTLAADIVGPLSTLIVLVSVCTDVLLLAFLKTELLRYVIAVLPLLIGLPHRTVFRGTNLKSTEGQATVAAASVTSCAVARQQMFKRRHLRYMSLFCWAFAFALGYLQHVGTFGSTALVPAGGSLFLLARAFASLVAFVAIGFARIRFHHLLLAGFLLIPYSANEFLIDVALFLAMVGYTMSEFMMWIYGFKAAEATGRSAVELVAFLQLGIELSLALGIIMGQLAHGGLFVLDPSVVPTSIAYALSVAGVLFFGSDANSWLIYDENGEKELPSNLSKEERAERVAESYGLTRRETEVFTFLVNGRSARFISETLGISQSTVETHIKNIYSKLGLNSKQDAIDLVS